MLRQSFYKVLKISSEVTTCSEVTTFLGVTNSLKVTFLSKVTVFLAEVAFSVENTYIKGAGTKGASTKSTNIGVAYSKGTCIENTLTYVGGACIGDACDTDTCIGSVCVNSVDVVKRSKMNLCKWG